MKTTETKAKSSNREYWAIDMHKVWDVWHKLDTRGIDKNRLGWIMERVRDMADVMNPKGQRRVIMAIRADEWQEFLQELAGSDKPVEQRRFRGYLRDCIEPEQVECYPMKHARMYWKGDKPELYSHKLVYEGGGPAVIRFRDEEPYFDKYLD